MKDTIQKIIQNSINSLSFQPVNFEVEHPQQISHGDYATNAALILSKISKQNSLTLAINLADEIKNQISNNQELKKNFEKVEVAGPGFINFYLTPYFFSESIKKIISENESFGKNQTFQNQKIAIEYTDPNPFKQFHIGHLMTNIIGESISTLFEWNGAEVKRFSYQGDVGRHVALTLWGIRFLNKPFPSENESISEKTKFLGEAYILASKKVEDHPTFEIEIQRINKLIYDRSDLELNEMYDKGREWSLEHFEEIYKILGTKFDHYFFESEVWKEGKKIVEENTPSVFEESEGAVIFPGEKYGLHTRVFISSDGLPLYETKDLGLAKAKYDLYKFDQSWIMTGNEQNDYFKVVIKALSLIYPETASKYFHLSHGMLRFASGKMSSRKGNVVTGESLINEMIEIALEKIKDRKFQSDEKEKIAKQVAIGALKYSILKQSIGKDIIFDQEKSLSFEGDSGPYLQYAETRARSLLDFAKEQKIEASPDFVETNLSKKLYQFSEIIKESLGLKAPHHLLTFLVEIAGLFNRFYAEQTIVEKENKASAGRLGLVLAFQIVMQNGLKALGIPIPPKM